MPEQDAMARARNFKEVALGYTLENALREAERCLMCADEPCIRGCPVGIDIPAFIQKIAEKHYHGAYDVITDTNLLPSVCGRVCPQENQCEGRVHRRRHAGARRHRPARALRRRHGDQGRLGERALHRALGLQGRHRRLGPGGHGLRRRHGEGRLRGHRLRGVPRAGRRAEIRDSRLPPAQRGGRRRDRQAEAARREVRVQHAGRAPLHDRADDHRDGLPLGLHRHRRGLPELHGNSRRVAERRVVGQRAPHPLQPDAGARLPELRHADAAGQAGRGDRRRQHGDGCAARVAAPGRREGVLRLPPQQDRGPCARRGDPPRRRRRRRVPLADEPGRGAGRRAEARARHALPEDGAGRAGCVGPPPAGAGAGQRVRIRMRQRRLRHRHQRQSDSRPDLEAEARQARLHRSRREPRDVDRRRVCRRRHRHRCGDGDRGDGSRAPRRARDEGVAGTARHRCGLRRRGAARARGGSASRRTNTATRGCA